MLINLTDCFKVRDKKEEFVIRYESDSFSQDGEELKVLDSKDGRLKVTNIGNGQVEIEGNISITFMMRCGRCLERVDYEANLEFSETAVEPDGFHEIDADDQFFMEGYELNVETLINNELYISLPMKVLCREDCKGLCLKCGCNLNEVDCGCDRFVPDPRMAAIQDIFKSVT